LGTADSSSRGAAALDGAIEKGLLEERDGQLHRPE
jgi:hypothetical protein